MALDSAQQGVLRNMAAAGLLSAALIFGVLVWQPDFLAQIEVLERRIVVALQWDAAVVACLIFTIGSLAGHRFFTPADIDGSGMTSGTDQARIMQARLQNTLEQSGIAVFVHMLWVAVMPREWFGAIPVAALLFVLGRLFFFIGYRHGAAARAFGFALTFYPTIMLFAVTVLYVVIDTVRGAG